MTATLSADQRAAFERDGFLVLPDFVSAESCARLRRQATTLVADFDPDEHRTVFSPTDQGHARDDYFSSSGDKARWPCRAATDSRSDRAFAVTGMVEPRWMSTTPLRIRAKVRCHSPRRPAP